MEEIFNVIGTIVMIVVICWAVAKFSTLGDRKK